MVSLPPALDCRRCLWDYKGSPDPRARKESKHGQACVATFFRPWWRSAPWPRAAVVRSSRVLGFVGSAGGDWKQDDLRPPTACSSVAPGCRRHRRLFHQHPAGRRAEPVRERLRRELHQQPAELPGQRQWAPAVKRMTPTPTVSPASTSTSTVRCRDNGSIRMFFNFTPSLTQASGSRTRGKRRFVFPIHRSTTPRAAANHVAGEHAGGHRDQPRRHHCPAGPFETTIASSRCKAAARRGRAVCRRSGMRLTRGSEKPEMALAARAATRSAQAQHLQPREEGPCAAARHGVARRRLPGAERELGLRAAGEPPPDLPGGQPCASASSRPSVSQLPGAMRGRRRPASNTSPRPAARRPPASSCRSKPPASGAAWVGQGRAARRAGGRRGRPASPRRFEGRAAEAAREAIENAPRSPGAPLSKVAGSRMVQPAALTRSMRARSARTLPPSSRTVEAGGGPPSPRAACGRAARTAPAHRHCR